MLVIDGRPLRLHLPQQTAVAAGAREVLSITHTDAILKLHRSHLTGAVEVGTARIDLPTELVRLLVPYAEARLNDYAYEDGWITREEAFDRWIELGGNPSSPSQRMGWLRGKVKSHLARNGLADVDALFESRRDGQWYANRIGLEPDQVILV